MRSSDRGVSSDHSFNNSHGGDRSYQGSHASVGDYDRDNGADPDNHARGGNSVHRFGGRLTPSSGGGHHGYSGFHDSGSVRRPESSRVSLR